ncbi:MAG TPA: zinc ribbon domain-containing protein [Clostridia bacterium]|nr:zinc ribbon domain-containing protein [Clostridia bacterium]
MPTYEFHCQKCGHHFTQFLSITQRKKAVCTKCGSKQIEQIYRCCNVVGSNGGSGGQNSGTSAGCTRTGGCGSCSGCS